LVELGRPARRGTCGMGVGEAARGLEVRVGDLLAGARAQLEALAAKSLARARELAVTEEQLDVLAYFRGRCDPAALSLRYREILDTVDVAPVVEPRDALLEGAQGALLDRDRGFVPYVTPSRTTFDAAGAPGALRVGVLRAHAHRHGAGPLPTEGHRFEDPFNSSNRWQGPFRTGFLDLVMLRHGLAVSGGADLLAFTNLDKLGGLPTVRICAGYALRGERIAALPASTELVLECRPLDWLELPGWGADISGARALADLPPGARRPIDPLGGRLGGAGGAGA